MNLHDVVRDQEILVIVLNRFFIHMTADYTIQQVTNEPLHLIVDHLDGAHFNIYFFTKISLLIEFINLQCVCNVAAAFEL